MKNILIPVEKSSEGYPVIEKAIELAKKFDSKVTLLYVDNSKEQVTEFNDSGSISSRLPIGDHGLVDESNLPGHTGKDNIKSEKSIPHKKSLRERYIEQEKADNKNFLDFVELIYRKEGIKTDTILLEGDPASVILDEAERGDYDLVIMKTHTMKKRKRFMLGSVTNKVVHHINKPILIMR
jgi:nucleotide-binding universal stress UspA family protein